jgi:hypothetical protein
VPGIRGALRHRRAGSGIYGARRHRHAGDGALADARAHRLGQRQQAARGVHLGVGIFLDVRHRLRGELVFVQQRVEGVLRELVHLGVHTGLGRQRLPVLQLGLDLGVELRVFVGVGVDLDVAVQRGGLFALLADVDHLVGGVQLHRLFLLERHQRADARQQIDEADRLVHVVLGTRVLEAAVLAEGVLVRVAAHDDQRDALEAGVALELVAHREAVHTRQLDGQQDQVGAVVGGELQALGGVTDHGHGAGLLLESALQLIGKSVVGLENQDFGHGGCTGCSAHGAERTKGLDEDRYGHTTPCQQVFPAGLKALNAQCNAPQGLALGAGEGARLAFSS